MVLKDDYCEKCGEQYTDIYNKWCKSCYIDNLKIANWSSGNEKIDNLIQEMQLKIKRSSDIVFEWIPYNQFESTKVIEGAIYSAIWIEGPLVGYNRDKELFERNQNEKVKSYSINDDDDILHIYGISQNPSTKNYIMILKNEYCEKCDEQYTDIYKKWCKSCHIKIANLGSGNEKIDNFILEMQSKIKRSNDIVFEWIPYNQFENVKEIGEGGFAKIYSAIWTDGPLYYNKNKKVYKRSQNTKIALKCLCNSQNISNEFLNEV
ncbi:hypothetical protein C1645_828968 [Glomus cerebriforme]|uniref:Protein kinase domain-containing protein n=1 Tax=Glomus cerebriforme TaxID=658196 RepID=A0A397SRJ9_9GLOM|nr:hypothetical protein C1645_828968 [Glomus cerebriforme]